MRSLVALVLLLSAVPAHAQSAPALGRGWIGINFGAQPGGQGFDDAFDAPLYTEQEHVEIDYPGKGGQLFAVSGGYRVWKRVAIGVGFSRYARSGDATITARLPHPFFDNTFREIEGTVQARRTEGGVHLLIGWMVPISNRVQLLISGGPSAMSVEQTLVTDVNFTETFPYDTAEFTGADVNKASRTAAGFNAGADLFWMFSKTVGVGGLVQYTQARVRLDAGSGRSISVDAGGVQAGGGLRIVF